MTPPFRPPVLGVILAGGAGRRMAPETGGADKALLPLSGRPLLAHVSEKLGPQCAALALNAGGDETRFAAYDLAVIPDDEANAGQGPLAGILAGMEYAVLAGFDRIVTAPVDTPFLPDDYVARLLRTADDRPGAQIVCAETPDDQGRGRAHYVCGLFPVALREGLRAALAGGERRVSGWVISQGMATAKFDTAPGAPDPFLNINTPDDLARAEAALAR